METASIASGFKAQQGRRRLGEELRAQNAPLLLLHEDQQHSFQPTLLQGEQSQVQKLAPLQKLGIRN